METLFEDRYSRQITLLGKKNQKKLFKSRVCIIGCGAIGSVVASMLVRAGIGFVRIIDRDIVELSNLHRIELFAEGDVGESKALAAKERLGKINSECEIEALEDDIMKDVSLLGNVDLVIDCTDNIETRYLINKFCMENNVPWIYGAAIGSEGMSASFHSKPCFRCLFTKNTKSSVLGSCEALGVLAPAPHIIGSWQAMEAIKILTGKPDFGVLLHFSLGKEPGFRFSRIKQNSKCPVCKNF